MGALESAQMGGIADTVLACCKECLAIPYGPAVAYMGTVCNPALFGLVLIILIQEAFIAFGFDRFDPSFFALILLSIFLAALGWILHRIHGFSEFSQ